VKPTRRRTNGRRWLVRGVNLGDGQLVKCWVIVKGDVVTVRQWKTKTRIYQLDLAEAAGMIARRVQVQRCAA